MSDKRTAWKQKAQRSVGLVLGTLLSLLCLAMVFRGVQLSDVLRALREASPYYLGLALLSYAASIWAKAQRWRLLFYPAQGKMRLGRLASVILIGQTVNVWLLPHAGELARAYLIGEINGVSKAGAMGTVVLEKSLDSLMLLLFLAILAFLMPLPPWLQTSSILLSVALVILLLALLLAARYRERILIWGDYLIRRIPQLDRLHLSRRLIAAGDSLELLRRLDVNLQLVGWSALIWIIAALTNQFTLQAMGIAVPWYVSFFLLLVFQIGAIIPASPGRFGVYHYLAVQALALFAVEKSLALSFAIVLHLITYVLMSVAGAFCLWKENYDLQRLVRAVGSQPAASDMAGDGG